jgi:hypothetical protein
VSGLEVMVQDGPHADEEGEKAGEEDV